MPARLYKWYIGMALLLVLSPLPWKPVREDRVAFLVAGFCRQSEAGAILRECEPERRADCFVVNLTACLEDIGSMRMG